MMKDIRTMSLPSRSLASVADLIQILEGLKWVDKAHAHIRSWFRGHSKTGWSLEPMVYRRSFGSFVNEKDRFDRECHLSQDFRVMSAGLRTGRETDVDLYFLQQHYRMPTRLLDWTNNPLAALYFACSHNEGVDGELYGMDVYSLMPSGSGIATSRREEVQSAIQMITTWGKGGKDPDQIIAVRPDYFDRRVSLQRSCFTLHGPAHRELTSGENKTLTRIHVQGTKKADILRQLAVLGIDHFSIYGDMESLAKRLVEAYPV
jgi:hypothetical protein